MRKLYSIIFAAISALLLASSCQSFEEYEPLAPEVKTYTISISCPSDTKLGLNDSKPVWRAGDEIWVSDGTNSCKAVIDKSFDFKEKADITVSGLDGETLYVLYPYDANAYVENGQVIIDVPSLQSGDFADAGICAGSCPSADPVLMLHNTCPVIHFVSNDETLVTMQFDNGDGTVSGSMKVDLGTGDMTSYVKEASCVRMEFADRHNEFYLAFLPTTFNSNSKILFTTKEHHVGKITMSSSNTLRRGVIYEMGNLNSRIEMGSEPAVDLSARESANCYIVESGQTYRFRTVKGNTSKALKHVAYASVLWETTNTSSAVERFSLVNDVIVSEGEIYFSVPASAPNGNALIAAYDTSGQIVWSWHIWIVNEGVEFYTLDDGFYLMDRNLGATTSTPGTVGLYGMLYQWGRKDPFPSGGGLTSNIQAVLTGRQIAKVNCSAETGTLDYSIKNPSTLIYNTTGASWLNEDMTLWSADLKSEYDPCPPGYHIPSRDILEYLGGGTWNDSGKAYCVSVNGNDVSVPAAGRTYYSNGELSSTGSYGYYWWDSATGSTATLCMRAGADGIHFYQQGTGVYYSPQAFSVRCQKISATDDSQLLKIIYNVTMPDYSYKSLWYTSSSSSPNRVNWGDGSTSTIRNNVALYHTFGSTGEYTFTMQGYDLNSFTIRSLGDISEIDLSSF